MKDLEPILDVLCNYHAGYPLNEEEVGTLSEWMKESPEHEKLFRDLSKGLQWVMGSYEGNIREKIQLRLIEMEEQ